MRKLYTLIGVVSAMLMVFSSIATATEPVTSQSSRRVITITYNAYGIVTSSTTRIDSDIITEGDLWYYEDTADESGEGYQRWVDRNGNGVWDAGEGDIILIREKQKDGSYKYYYIGAEHEVTNADGSTTKTRVWYVDSYVTAEGGSTTVTHQTTIQTSSWQAGGLRLTTVQTDSSTTVSALGGDAELQSTSKTTDSYEYDTLGNLIDVTGGGSYISYGYFIKQDGTTQQYKSGAGTISRNFEMKDGQAVLASSYSVGDIFAYDAANKNPLRGGVNDVVDIGDSYSLNFTAADDWVYLGGQWLSRKSTEISLQAMHANHVPTAADPTYRTGITLATSLDGDRRIMEAANAADGALGISSVSRGEKITTLTYNDAGVMVRMSVDWPGQNIAGQINSLTNWQLTATSKSEGGYSYDLWVLDTANSLAEVGWSADRGYYLKDERQEWVRVKTINWTGGTYGDPAATGQVYQRDGKWYMRVSVWTGADGQQHEGSISVEINLDALDATSREALVGLLREYAASGEALTLYGVSRNGVLTEGAKLVAIGLGSGPFASHPYDYTGPIPAGFQAANTNFAEFVASMVTSPNWNKTAMAGMSAADRHSTLLGLYEAILSGRMSNGQAVTINGVTFQFVRENTRYSGGEAVRLMAGGVAGVALRHFTHDLALQLGLL